jgi:murein DD-endopeptidase MepM/ murein hydrolase activator NlpD
VLAHLGRGTVQSHLGAQVTPGDPLGRVGNSGNTSEPHLHVHAVRGRVTEPEQLLFTGDGVALRVEGAFPVRNDRLVFR